MADIRDEHGRPIQLTDELGRPVQLTDERGAPIHLTGVASATTHDRTTIGSELHSKMTHDDDKTHFAPNPLDYAKRGAGAVVGAGAATVGAAAGVGKAATHAVTGGGAPASHTHQALGAGEHKKELERSTSSSSSSSEDDGQGGRRKKKGLMQKIKEKLPGHNDKEAAAHSSTDTKVSSAAGGVGTGTTAVPLEHDQRKKGFMDKIKDKLPGHH